MGLIEILCIAMIVYVAIQLVILFGIVIPLRRESNYRYNEMIARKFEEKIKK